MSPIETSHATSDARSRLIALGAECELRTCARCGALIDGASCACRAAAPRRARPHLSLIERVESESAAPAVERLERLGCRGEVIA